MNALQQKVEKGANSGYPAIDAAGFILAPAAAGGLKIAGDTNLYRLSAGVLKTDGRVVAADANGIAFMANCAGAGNYSLWSTVGAEAQPRYRVAMDGTTQWGPGGSTAVDTNLYRAGVNTLTTDGSFVLGGGNLLINNGYALFASVDTATRVWLGGKVGAEAQNRYAVDGTGKIAWGPGGSTAVDTNLYRSAAGQLKTDGYFYAVQAIYAMQGTSTQVGLVAVSGSQAGLSFGSAGDTNLYRQAANALATDGAFYVRQSAAGSAGLVFDSMAANGAFIVAKQAGDSGFGRFNIQASGTIQWGAGGAAAVDTNLYRAGAGVLKTDGTIAIGAVGTSFPASPVDGQEYVYAADIPNGVYWRFVYNTAQAAWIFSGGSPLSAYVGPTESTVSTGFTDLATVGPSITLPFAGTYLVEYFARAGPAAGDSTRYAPQYGATAPNVNESACNSLPAGSGAGAANESISAKWIKTGLGAVTVTMKYRSGGGGTAFFSDRWLYVTPIRR